MDTISTLSPCISMYLWTWRYICPPWMRTSWLLPPQSPCLLLPFLAWPHCPQAFSDCAGVSVSCLFPEWEQRSLFTKWRIIKTEEKIIIKSSRKQPILFLRKKIAQPLKEQKKNRYICTEAYLYVHISCCGISFGEFLLQPLRKSMASGTESSSRAKP